MEFHRILISRTRCNTVEFVVQRSVNFGLYQIGESFFEIRTENGQNSSRLFREAIGPQKKSTELSV